MLSIIAQEPYYNQLSTIKGYIIQICSGITCGIVLNGELNAQRLQKVIYLHCLQTIS